MPPREPMWYCHECHAEMRPLMTPGPTCASCRGDFVEKLENPEDDPRELHHHHHGLDDEPPSPGDMPPNVDMFLHSIFRMLEQGGNANRTRNAPSPSRSPPSSGISFEFHSSSGSGTRSFTFGGPNTLGRTPGPEQTGPGRPPTMSEYMGQRGDPGGIGAPLMAQYLSAMLGGGSPFGDLLFPGGAGGRGSGRMGDYVFTQEALDDIISQMMENGNSHRPVPASEEIIEKLPRDVLQAGSELLEKDCAVCKEQFKLETDDPDEQIIVTLPCKHPFHQPCIVPWLKSSGTCPVCRHALVPQPEHNDTPRAGTSGSPPRQPPPGGGAQGLFSTLFNYAGRGNPQSNSGSNNNSHTDNNGSNGGSSSQRPNIPGAFDPNDLD